MLNTILGSKIEQTQKFTQEGKRIPVTKIKTGPCYIVQIKTKEKNGYNALLLGFGEKKIGKAKKPLLGQYKKAGLKRTPIFLTEARIDDVSKFKLGEKISLEKVFKVGDKIKITGWSKGKGFAGVVKRWGFKGGPRTHGQSDRERAPGSIGQTTTPGRVYKGKRMAGRMGGKRVTIKGLTVVDIDEKNEILEVKGLVPGAKESYLIIKKENAAS